MDIFPMLLSEHEIDYFNEQDFDALRSVLDATTAGYIQTYLNNPGANASTKQRVLDNLGPTVDSLTFHLKLQDSGILELVRSLNPESLAFTETDLDTLIERLSFLEENEDKIRTTIPARTSEAYNNFVGQMTSLVMRMRTAGTNPTYPDLVQRIKANKFLFYVTGEKDHSTGVGLLNSRKRQWVIALNGARWLKYCNERNISKAERSKF